MPGINDKALTRTEAAERLGIDVAKVTELLKTGKIPYWKPERKYMMWMSDVDAYIEQITKTGTGLPSLLKAA